MSNVGDIKTFTLPGTTTDGLRYVWKWWDGSVDCTTSNTIQKALNTGGNPADGFMVRYVVEPVDSNGKSAEYSGALVVNNPPSIVPGSTALSQNGQQVNFTTTASLTVYDLEGEALTFGWTDNTVAIGSGTITPVGLIPGTYAGTYAGMFWGTRASIDLLVEHSTPLGLTITDASGGETSIEFPIHGFQRVGATFSPSSGPQSQLGSASSLPIVVVGEPAVFSVYATTPDFSTVFTWGFWGTNGWAVPTSSNGTTSVFPDGSIQNTAVKDTAHELPGRKEAQVFIADLLHSTLTQILIPVDLVVNGPPLISAVTNEPVSPVAGDWIKFSVDYADPNADIAVVKWDFTVPLKTLWGRTVWLDTGTMTPSQAVLGSCTVYDRFNASDSSNINVQLV